MHIPLVFYVLVYNQGCHREGSKVKYKKEHISNVIIPVTVPVR